MRDSRLAESRVRNDKALSDRPRVEAYVTHGSNMRTTKRVLCKPHERVTAVGKSTYTRHDYINLTSRNSRIRTP